MKKCPICEKNTRIPVDDILNEIEGYIFIIKGERCTNCGEEFIGEEEGQKMINIARKLGVWGEPLKLHRKLIKSSRGTILHIPADLEANLHIKGNERVSISKRGNNKFLVEIES
jgi:hypothetical protein